PQPWYAREADEVHRLGDEPELASVEDLVACLQRARVDTLWLGAWRPDERLDLIALCEAGGIGVVGPTSSTVHRLTDIARDADSAEPADDSRLRRVEVDILADEHGTIWTLGGRDVSVRRDGQVLIAEAPCAAISIELATRIRAEAERLARSVDYRGAGVFTFVHDGADFSLAGVDCVAAPDHATTEERTGASVIGWRLRVHRGEPLTGVEPVGDGIVVEARLLAEDPDANFVATSGRVALLKFPVGTGVRIDANRRVGDPVDPVDPLLAVITAWGPDREVALGRVQRALERTAIVIDGGATNRSFLLGLLAHPDVVSGQVDETWLERILAERALPTADPVALLVAAVEAYEGDRAHAQESFYASAARGRPQHPLDVGGSIELGYRGASYQVAVHRVGPRNYSIRYGSAVADVTVDALDQFERRITCGGQRHRVVVSPTDTGFRVEIGHGAHLVDREDGLVVRADWPALVVSALVEPGDVVAAGDPIVVLESMKMETTVTAPFAGEVLGVSVAANAQVDRGAALVRIRQHSVSIRTTGDADRSPVDLSGLGRTIDFNRKPCDRVYTPLGDYLLGYDLAAADLRKLLTQQRRLAEIAAPADAGLIECEDGLLDIYAELGALYRPQTEDEPDVVSSSVENTQEYLVSFLQWLDVDRAGLPDVYRWRLERALERFGVHGLQHTPELES
ncbi:MAG TPA: biotin/lipoyl-containing protein, partial [Ilumatobacteraceae bacterium]|nr:biotin/lipoyl-containing protein [Ilumatobacteraceae bacterium]